jgi:hypothetical protein
MHGKFVPVKAFSVCSEEHKKQLVTALDIQGKEDRRLYDVEVVLVKNMK